jgi:hypothetical protein
MGVPKQNDILALRFSLLEFNIGNLTGIFPYASFRRNDFDEESLQEEKNEVTSTIDRIGLSTGFCYGLGSPKDVLCF